MFKNNMLYMGMIVAFIFYSACCAAEDKMTYGERLIKGTHNSYSGSIDRPGNVRGSIIQQLDWGFRSLEYDVHPYNKQNIYLNYWSAKERVFTAFSLGHQTFNLDYRPDNGQVAINKFNMDGTDSDSSFQNVYLTRWAPKAREFTSFTVNGRAFVLAYQQQDGLIGIAEFTYKNEKGALSNIYLSDWADKSRVFTAFTLQNRAFIVNYRADSGRISIDEFSYSDGKGELNNVYQSNWANKSREISTFKLLNGKEEKAFIVNYRDDSGQVSVDEFSINDDTISLRQAYKTNWEGNRKRELAAFSVKDRAYVVNYTHTNGIVSIDEFFQGPSEYEMGQVVYLRFGDTERQITALPFGNLGKEVTTSEGQPVLFLSNFRRDNGQISVDKIDLNTPTLGHDDIGHDVDLDGNPTDLTLKTWLKIVADWQVANPEFNEPLFLMIETKGHRQLNDYFRLWLPGDKVNHIINTVYATFGQDKVRLLESQYTIDKNYAGVTANTPYEELMGKVILYIEAPAKILENGECVKADYLNKTAAMANSYRSLCNFRYNNVIKGVQYKSDCVRDKSCAHPGSRYLYRLFRMGEGDNGKVSDYPLWFCDEFNFLSSDIVDKRYLDLTCPDKS
ncbi:MULTISPECIES: hypothetical protein [unclassified Pseudoalteromonas]|uniref:hypothetical protein n=1 Tax=unclassified Pseudoalteromonas TaxID=194690 RepID=UPI0020974E19|nr:hypothetical protein [Pseudoalteromonas sp. XMcav2-N]MCO7187860.1 hypothetical protein [Pseudoalteromonas sp. XMcav2-N]